jgi:beta-N-acetylhexosaminidase
VSAAGACILAPAGPALAPDERAFFGDADPWGFILFARNVESPEQLRRLTDALCDTVARDAAILIDQEGGRVARLGPPHWRSWMPPLDQVRAAGPDRAARSMWLRYRLIAAELRAVGIDTNCAPVADIAEGTTHPFLKNRCYGTDLASVVACARAVAEGLMAGGVLPVLKHIPGHGRAAVDSHRDVPVVGTGADALGASDFAAFRALADLPVAMTAHVVYDAIDGRSVATCSPAAINLIREHIGFDGLLMTDDISMRALTGSLELRCRDAIAAGCDLVLHCNGDAAEMEVVAEASGTLSDEAARRAGAALARRTAPQPVDIPALEAELAELLGGQGA